AGLELEAAVRALPRDPEDHLLVAALLGAARGHLLGLPAMALGIAEVHLVELAREQRGFFPALAGTDLDDDVLVVERIARDELGPQLLGQPIDLERGGALLFAREVAQVGVVAKLQLASVGHALLAIAQSPDRVDDRLELRVLLPDGAQAVAVARHARVAHRLPELVVALLDLHETRPQ